MSVFGPRSIIFIFFLISVFFISSLSLKPAWSEDNDTFLNKDFPTPDIYALNGKLSKQIFQENKIEKNKIIKIEATRYQYLSEFFINKNFKRDFQNGITKKSFNLLVVCDYSFYYTKKQLDIISNLDEEILKEFSVLIKPHPGSINNFQNFNKEKYSITFNSISKLVNQVDLVFLCNSLQLKISF